MGIGLRQFERPTSRPTTDVKNPVNTRQIGLLGQKSAHSPGEVAILLDQTYHLCATITQDIGVFTLGGIRCCHKEAPLYVLVVSEGVERHGKQLLFDPLPCQLFRLWVRERMLTVVRLPHDSMNALLKSGERLLLYLKGGH